MLMPTLKKLKLLLILTFLMVGMFVSTPLAFAAPTLPDGFEMEVFATGLNAPTKLVNVPDGRMFVAEKGGTVRVIKNGQLLPDPLLDISDHVNNIEDRGLLSIEIDPDFMNNGIIYLLYTHYNQGTDAWTPQVGRLTKVQLPSPDEDQMIPVVNPPETPVLGSILEPYDDGIDTACVEGSDCIPSDALSHTIGDMDFDYEGNLFVSVGDGSGFVTVDPRAMRAQNINWLVGKVLRITPDGQGLPDNPFYTGNPDDVASKVFQTGLRNPFRLMVDHDNIPFVTDVGWYSHEEVNRGAPGENFGWPCYEGVGHMVEYEQHPETAPGCAALYASGVVNDPYHTYPHTPIGAGSAGIGGTFIKNPSWPAEYMGNYFFGDYNDQFIKRIVVDHANGHSFNGLEGFGTGFEGNIQNFTYPNEDLGWISIWTGTIYRITYTPDNRAPIAQIEVDVTSGDIPLTVNFVGDTSYDPDSDPIVSYAWDFGNGDTSDVANPTYTFVGEGTFTVTLTVSDGELTDTEQISISAGNNAPVVTIDSPVDDFGYLSPAAITYSGTVTDVEDGTIPAENVNWQIIVHHNDHIHVALDDIHAYSGTVDLTYHGNNTWYEMIFSATDSDGVTASDTVTFRVLESLNVCTDPTQGPVALYNLDGDVSDSGQVGSNDATQVGNSFASGWVNEGMEFADGYLQTPDLGLTNFSISMWIRPSEDDSIRHLVSNKAGGTETNGFGLFMNAWGSASRELIMEVGDGAAGKYIPSPYNTIVPNQWQLITATYDGTNITLYRNGAQVAQAPAEFDFATAGPLRFGQFMDGTWQYTGKMDDIGVWNRALSAGEVYELYNYTRTLTCGDSDPEPTEFGQIMFRVHELDTAGAATGGFVEGATIKVLETGTTNTIMEVPTMGDWAIVDDVPVGTYDFVVYKNGWDGASVQVACDGTQAVQTLQDAVTGDLVAAHQTGVAVNVDATTWCRDVWLQPTVQDPGDPQYGKVMFRVHEYDAAGNATGGYVDGATIKLTDADGSVVDYLATSQYGWAEVAGVLVGDYGMMVYKPGYQAEWVQTGCDGSNAFSDITNSNTDGLSAAWHTDVPIAADETTWCHDVALRALE